ncbi:unnamed protein product [Aphanomyces euteiches]
MNPYQGRGAPEVDILEGGGAAISTSIQVAPGMPSEYRRMPPQKPGNIYCVYGKGCATPGANIPDAPSSAFAYRGHKNWYQGMRYAANDRCPSVPADMQSYEQVENGMVDVVVLRWPLGGCSEGKPSFVDLQRLRQDADERSSRREC